MIRQAGVNQRAMVRDGCVARALRSFRRRRDGIQSARLFVIAIGAMLLVLLVALWADLIWPLSSAMRFYLARGIPCATLLAACAWGAWWRWKASDQRLVWQIDQCADTGGLLLAGWELEHRPPQQGADLTRQFAREAAETAGRKLSGLQPVEILPATAIWVAVQRLLILLAAILLLAAASPRIARHQVLRFLLPEDDLPPFTGATLELQPAEYSVRYGDDVTVIAAVGEGELEQVQLMVQDAEGSSRRAPMLLQADGRWQAVLARVTKPLTVYAESGRTRSRKGQVHVQMLPHIEAVRVHVSPPSYTQRPPYVGPIPDQGIGGLIGTQVRWSVQSNRPLQSGRLIVRGSSSAPAEFVLRPEATSPHEAATHAVVGQLTLESPGTFELTVTDVDGNESLERVTGQLRIEADKRPTVRIIEPKPISLATPEIQLPVVVAAEDDYGITRIDLYRSLNGSTPTRMSFPITPGPRQQVGWALDLPGYQVQAGDEIRLFARVEDNDPHGPQGSESPTTTIRIVSAAEMQTMLLRQQGIQSLQAKYLAANRALENLAEALRRVEDSAQQAADQPPDGEAAAALRASLQAAEQAAADAAAALEQAAANPLELDIDQRIAERVRTMAQSVRQAQSALRSLAAASDGTMASEQRQQLAQLAVQLQQDRSDLRDQAIDPLGKLQQALPLIAAQQQFTQLAAQQRDLAQRMEALRGETTRSAATDRRLADLEAEQQQLRDQLAGLLAEIQQQAERLPADDEFQKLRATAQEFAAAVRNSGAESAMAGAQQGLLQDQFEQAAQQAHRAADILESFLGQCDGMGNGACQACELAFHPSRGGLGLGKSLEQLMQMLGLNAGNSPGGRPGAGPGWGAGAGFAQRFPGPRNVGLYATWTSAAPNAGGKGNQPTAVSGANVNANDPSVDPAKSDNALADPGQAGGQTLSPVPTHYRARVADYFERLTRELGEQP